jgi:pantoate--beta-alanine ligase
MGVGKADGLEIVREVSALRTAVADLRARHGSVALVPTMGALPAGHLSLVAGGRERAGAVVATLFVNPTQFGAGEDFTRYPRQEAEDAKLLESAGARLLFAPAPQEVYPQGFATTVSVAGIDRRWEGEARPGHFSGVATVVTKLLTMSGADVALFGEKDWQQLAIIRRLAADLNLPVVIAGSPTIRDSDGLALSSRNAYLSPEQRQQAAVLPATLLACVAALESGEDVAAVLARGRAALLSGGFAAVDYLALVDPDSLEPVATTAAPSRLLAAARMGTTRLLDNMAVRAG